MKHLPILVALFTVHAARLASADVLVAGNKQTRTIDCAKDPAVLIAGNDNTIKLIGSCKLVQLPGNHNKVTADRATSIAVAGNSNTVVVTAVDAITIMGNKNAVTWSKTIGGDDEPDVAELGSDNKVIKK